MDIVEFGKSVMECSALVTEESASLIQIVELFETGAENIYLVDEQGRYRWRAAQRSKSRVLYREESGFQILMYPLEPIIFGNEISQDNLPSLMETSERTFARNQGISEFPIVDRGGRIVRVVRTERHDKELDWGGLPAEIVLDQLQGKDVYVSSKNNMHIAKFLSKYGDKLQIKQLSASNMKEALSSKGILLYDVDIFPECHKISIKELFERCKREITIRNYAKDCVLSKDWVSVKMGPNVTLTYMLKFFDESYQAVHFEDSNGDYQGSLSLPQMKKEFAVNGVIPTFENLGIPYVEDEYERKKAWAERLLGSNIHEAVFLKNKRIVSNGVLGLGGVLDLSERSMMFRQKPYWNMISIDVARDFFGDKCRILLSSNRGAMSGFKERFADYWNIEVYDGSQMESYITGEFDWLIFGAEVWPIGKTKVCQGRLLYVDLLSESLRRYWRDRGIAYYACDVQIQPKGIAGRMAAERTQPEKPSSTSSWQGLREDYVFHADYDGDEFIKVIGSHRIDAPHLDHFTRTVWVTGPCIAFGDMAPFGETVEGKLQESLNNVGLPWRVMNCGSFGTNNVVFSDFNTLNYLMDLPMREGDIVIHFTQYLWKSSLHFPLNNFFTTSDAFDDPQHIDKKYWHDMCAAHMNKYGYEVWANFLFEKLVGDFKNKEASLDGRFRIVKPYSQIKADIMHINNENLRKYLHELSRHKHDVRGAIVMNANPFTLGHLHLVEEARKSVDFLYVFVVEEDKSWISFKDRYAMVQKNCERLSNVEVLPSGQYMISSITFADYFQKEAKQNEKVLPTKDVKLFAEAVAPVLGITKRFVGEEPFDKVTRRYNEVMKDILPNYGIELVEIPRKSSIEGVPINATQVRKWLSDGNFKECEGFLPAETLNYLKEMLSSSL